MKAKIMDYVGFAPIKIEITIENEEELRLLYMRLNTSIEEAEKLNPNIKPIDMNSKLIETPDQLWRAVRHAMKMRGY